MKDYCASCPSDCPASYLYIMDNRGDGALKVGYAKNVAKRLAQLRRKTGLPIALRAKFKARCEFLAMEAEDLAHGYLKEFWAGRGEWFFCSVEVAEKAISRAIEAAR